MRKFRLITVYVNQFTIVVRSSLGINPMTGGRTRIQECEAYITTPKEGDLETCICSKTYMSTGEVTALHKFLKDFFLLDES